MFYGVVIAGGSGRRLWPKSRKSLPKFLLKVKSGKSLIEQSVDRLKQDIPVDNILVLTNRSHLGPVKRALSNFPRKNIIAEPVSRNTAPAISLAAALIRKKDPEAVLFIAPADQIIEGKKAFKDILRLSYEAARKEDEIVTIGVKPKYPATGYGYIKTGKPCKGFKRTGLCRLYKVDRFLEKPSPARAKALLRTGKYLWNSGIFIAKAEVLLGELRKYSPAVYRTISRIEASLSTKNRNAAIERYYKSFPDISIDYAVMEKSRKSMVISSDIRWDDIGSWNSIIRYLKRDNERNYLDARHLGISTKNSVIISENNHLIATLNVDNMIIVHTKDATLICKRDDAENVKRLVELAGSKGLTEYI